MAKKANVTQIAMRAFGQNTIDSSKTPAAGDYPDATINDKTSAPVDVREGRAKQYWELLPACIEIKDDADRRNHAAKWGGHGYLAWCLAGCPSGQMDNYMANQ